MIINYNLNTQYVILKVLETDGYFNWLQRGLNKFTINLNELEADLVATIDLSHFTSSWNTASNNPPVLSNFVIAGRVASGRDLHFTLFQLLTATYGTPITNVIREVNTSIPVNQWNHLAVTHKFNPVTMTNSVAYYINSVLRSEFTMNIQTNVTQSSMSTIKLLEGSGLIDEVPFTTQRYPGLTCTRFTTTYPTTVITNCLVSTHTSTICTQFV